MLDEAETKGWRAEKVAGKRNRGESREKREKAPLGEARLSEEEGTREATRSVSQAVAKPSEVAKRSGTPNSRIVTRPEVSGRALRANRCAHVRREWARSARESGAGVTAGVAESAQSPDSAWTSTRLQAKQLEAGTPMNPATPVMPEERSRTDDHWMQQHAHLARLCRRPAIPLARLVASGQGRQLR